MKIRTKATAVRQCARRCKNFCLVMKITTLFLIMPFVQANAKGYSHKITLHEKNISLAIVLQQIKAQCGYVFISDKYDLEKPLISIDVKNATIDQALPVCFNGLPLAYKILDRTVIIEQTVAIDNDRSAAELSKTVKGQVVDENGKPLPGASIKVKDTNLGTTTNGDGKFTLNNVPDDAILVITFIGYNASEISVKQNLEVIQLTPSSSNLSDVVVVGYGTQKKIDLSGAVSQVKMDDVLQSRPVNNIGAAIQGAIPGLNLSTGSGQPGTQYSFNVRGMTSLNGGAPLILVDNIAVDNVSTINPADVETVTLLKDASSSAIYGARAAFGVLLITTKKGAKNQPMKFEYSANFSPTQVFAVPDKATPLDFVNALSSAGQINWWAGQNLSTWKTMIEQYNQNNSLNPLPQVNGIFYPLKYYDQYKSAFPGGFEQLHNFAVSGGSDKVFFRTSVGYSYENGPYTSNHDYFTKWNFNTTLTANLTKALSIQTNVFYNNGEQGTPNSFTNAFYYLSTDPSFSPLGMFTDPTTGKQTPYRTPATMAQYEPYATNSSNETRLSTKLIFAPIKKFSVTSEVSFDQPGYTNVSYQETGNKYTNPTNFSTELLNSNSNYDKNIYAQTHSTINLYAKYGINTVSGHNFEFLAGANQEIYHENYVDVNRQDLVTSTTPSLSTATGTFGGSDNYLAYAVQALFGRINYNYKNKYIFEANARYDGSSRFMKGNQYGFFPSASAAWNVMEESFMEPLHNIVQVLKPRLSFGSIGNQGLTDNNGNLITYAYLPLLYPTNASWLNPQSGTPYVSINPPNLVSSNYTWEKVQTANLGIDFALLNNRLTGSFDYYIRKTLNMLVPGGQAPATLGTSFPQQNAADLETKGAELNIQWSDHIGQVKYSVAVNVSNNNSYITRYANNPAGLLNDYYVGEKLGQIWGYKTQGFFTVNDFVPGNINPATMLPYQGTVSKLLPGIATYSQGSVENPNPGDIRYTDINHDGKIDNGNNTLSNHGDLAVIGNTNPNYIFGLRGSAAYKDFDFSFALRGDAKSQAWINNYITVPYTSQYTDIYKDAINVWTPADQNAKFARIYPSAGGNTGYNYQVQTRYLFNTAFLRVQSLALGYSVPTSFVKKLSLDKVRVFFSGENLFTFDHLPKGIDPETSDLNAGVQYPYLKKYSFGFNVTF